MPTPLIDRTGADALIPLEYSREMISSTIEQSDFLRLARRLPDMSRNQKQLQVVDALPTAAFVNGDTGQKQTTNVKWTKELITAEEIAVIVPIPESVLDDADYDIWTQVRPMLAEAAGALIDAAVFHGTNKPSSWPTGIVVDAAAKSQTLDYSTHIGTTGNTVFTAFLGPSGVFSLVENDGYEVNGIVAALSMRSTLRGLTDTTNRPIFLDNPQQPGQYLLDGQPVGFNRNGGLDTSAALAIVGDWNYAVWSMRQDITFKLFTEGVIQDAAGNIVFNLMQQDMVALRMVMRMGWARPNPANRIQTTKANRYPFAVLVP